MTSHEKLDSTRPIPPVILDRAIAGRNLSANTLGEVLGAGTTLVVFLRHLG